MILPFSSTHKLIPIPTLFTRASLFSLLILAHHTQIPKACAFTSLDKNQNHNQSHNPPISAMKVHPIPRNRNVAVQYGLNNPEGRRGGSGKNLRRLPHIFSRVLELPFRSDADVSIQESPDCFRFVAETDCIDDVRAHTIEIHPGVTKIVIRGGGFVGVSLDELELDMWRFRLPESTLPGLATAVCVDGELVVTVPKIEGGSESDDAGDGVDDEDGEGREVWGDGNGSGEFRGDIGGRLVLVQ